MNKYQLQILKNSVDARRNEVVEYQVNIDNYTRLLVEIGDDHELQDFKKDVDALLKSSIIEQKKSKLILKVIEDQIKEVDK